MKQRDDYNLIALEKTKKSFIGQTLEQNTILHRLLFSCDIIKDPTIIWYRFMYRKKKLTPNTIEKIMIASGFEKVKESQWKLKDDGEPAPKG